MQHDLQQDAPYDYHKAHAACAIKLPVRARDLTRVQRERGGRPGVDLGLNSQRLDLSLSLSLSLSRSLALLLAMSCSIAWSRGQLPRVSWICDASPATPGIADLEHFLLQILLSASR